MKMCEPGDNLNDLGFLFLFPLPDCPTETDSMSGHADSLKCMCDDFFLKSQVSKPQFFQKDS